MKSWRRIATASALALLLEAGVASAQSMVMVMQGDGSLSTSTPQTSFTRNYYNGIGQGSAEGGLPIRGGAGDSDAKSDVRMESVAGPSRVARPEILAAIDHTALRHASHPGLRRAGISVTEWRLLYRSNIEIESAYDPQAHSTVGAVGLGQLMPETAADLGVD